MKIHHIALDTPVFDKTKAFYETVCGCSYRGGWGEAGDRKCMLHLKDGCILELFERTEQKTQGAFWHIAIATDEVDKAYETALKNGATVHTPPKDVVIDMEKPMAARLAFVYGTAGEIIEFFHEK